MRQPHLTQARLLQLYLSNAGEQMAEEGRVLVAGVEARMLMLFSNAERDQFGDLIRRCLATLVSVRYLLNIAPHRSGRSCVGLVPETNLACDDHGRHEVGPYRNVRIYPRFRTLSQYWERVVL